MKRKWAVDDDDEFYTEDEKEESHHIELSDHSNERKKKEMNTSNVVKMEGNEYTTRNVDEWDSEDVYKWLSSVDDGAFKQLALEFKNENIRGRTMKNITVPQLQSGFSLVLGDAMEFEDLREDLLRNLHMTNEKDGESKNKTISNDAVVAMLSSENERKQQDLNDWSVDDVYQWLSSVDDGVVKHLAIQFKSAKVDGKMLRNITESDEIFGSEIELGDILQFIDYRDELLTKMDAIKADDGDERILPDSEPAVNTENTTGSTIEVQKKKETQLFSKFSMPTMDIPVSLKYSAESTKEDSSKLITPKISPMSTPVISANDSNAMSAVALDETEYKDKELNEWNVNDVYQWLCSVDLIDVAVQFKKAKIRGLILKEMTIQQLNEENVFDIPYGDKMLFIRLRNELLIERNQGTKSDDDNEDDDGSESKEDVYVTKKEETGDMQAKKNEKLDDLRRWFVEELSLPQYFDIFVEEGFDDLESVRYITMDDLDAIGISKLGHKKKVLRKAKELQKD